MRLAFLLLLLTGCASVAPGARLGAEARTATEAPGASSALAGTEWRLVAIRIAGGKALAPEGEGDFTIAFGTDGVFTGQADCNQYGGTYRTEPDSTSGALVLGSAATTIAACAPVSSSRVFFAALNSVVRYNIAGDRLTLGGTQGRALVFERMGEMPSQETLQDFTYTCPGPGEPFSFRIRTGPGEVAVSLPARFDGRKGGTYGVLGQVRSASGAKYEDGPLTVWTKGLTEALLIVDGQTFVCTAP